VVLDTWQISEANVNELNVFFLDVCKDLCRILKHISPVFQMMAACIQPIGFLAIEALLMGGNLCPSGQKLITFVLHRC
jgi:hypothetical protein